LNVIVVFGCKVSYQVFDGNTGIGFSLSFQLFQLLIIGSDVEAVEDSPVQVQPHVNGLVEDTVFFYRLPGSPDLGVGIVHSSCITGR
jgi:hypothetical protein